MTDAYLLHAFHSSVYVSAEKNVRADPGSQKAVMSAEKVLEVMLDEATGVDDDSNLLWDADFTEGFMKGAGSATGLVDIQRTMVVYMVLISPGAPKLQN